MHNFSIAAIKSNERRTNNRHIKIHVPSCPVLSLLLLLITIGDTMMLIGMKKTGGGETYSRIKWSNDDEVEEKEAGEEKRSLMWFLRFSLFDENDPRQSFVLIFQREEGRRGREWDTNYDTKDTLFRFTSSLYYFILFHGCFVLFFVCVPVIAFCKRTEVKEKKRNRKNGCCASGSV